MGNEWEVVTSSEPAAATPTWGNTTWIQAPNPQEQQSSYQQQWYSYYAQQQASEKPMSSTAAPPPPLPTAPPPQAPPPPSSAAPAWTSTTYYNQTQQQQAPETSYTQDGQANSQVTGASYGYPTYPGSEQYSYGSSGYPSYGYGYTQQGNDSYSQTVGPYASSGAAYQPTTSYPSTSTYYNNGVYQQPGAYQGTAYSGTWNGENSTTATAATTTSSSYVNYGSYPGYSGGYQQPGSYYQVAQQGNEAAPPGTEAGVPGDPAQLPAQTYASVVAQGYATPANQPPPPGIQASWQTQGSSTNGHWNSGNQAGYQQVQVPQTAPTYKPQTPLPYHKSPVKIQMNPRIPQVLQSERPAYVSVAGKVPPGKSSELDPSYKPGMFPPALRAYVERALSRCTDDSLKAVCQLMMKEIITKASSDGTIFTKNWDIEPLFPLPNATGDVKGEQTLGTTKKTKSRWEPVSSTPETNTSTLQTDLTRTNLLKPSGTVGSMSWVKRDSPWNKAKSFQLPTQQQQPHQHQQQQQQHQTQQQFQQPPKQPDQTKPFKASGKRPRKAIMNVEPENSSDNDGEKELGGVIMGTITSETTPEENKRRQTRSKRFESSNRDAASVLKTTLKNKVPGGGINASTRRASAMKIASSYGDASSQAVEDIDWDALTVRGTCQEIEKRYLRLTSAPDPATVRPEEVLAKALEMVKTTPKNYLYKCEQLKSIRQDLTVQRIRNEFAAKVYEAHARIALEAGDLAEYNQCQTQLKTLYTEGIKGCSNEFAAYQLLYTIFQNGSNRDLLSSMARLSLDAKEDEAVAHALAVRKAVALENHVLFFRLYKTAPNLNSYLMDLYVEKMRFEALRCMSRANRPTVPLEYIARVLGFTSGNSTEKEELDECEEWIKAHGGQILVEANGERQFDAKGSSTTLFMPDPEDAVAHGDSSLAVNDFLTRVSSGS